MKWNLYLLALLCLKVGEKWDARPWDLTLLELITLDQGGTIRLCINLLLLYLKKWFWYGLSICCICFKYGSCLVPWTSENASWTILLSTPPADAFMKKSFSINKIFTCYLKFNGDIIYWSYVLGKCDTSHIWSSNLVIILVEILWIFRPLLFCKQLQWCSLSSEIVNLKLHGMLYLFRTSVGELKV